MRGGLCQYLLYTEDGEKSIVLLKELLTYQQGWFLGMYIDVYYMLFVQIYMGLWELELTFQSEAF